VEYLADVLNLTNGARQHSYADAPDGDEVKLAVPGLDRCTHK
jgi:hypothetical protein